MEACIKYEHMKRNILSHLSTGFYNWGKFALSRIKGTKVLEKLNKSKFKDQA